jgi:hypothetical protein
MPALLRLRFIGQETQKGSPQVIPRVVSPEKTKKPASQKLKVIGQETPKGITAGSPAKKQHHQNPILTPNP